MNVIELKRQIPYHWKIQSFNKDNTKASCVAYLDARDVMDLLDDVVGAANWKDEYYQVKDTMFCTLSIKINNEWVSKSDGGAETSNEFISSEAKTKGEPSDAFKRAAVKWGVGRFLYNLDIKWVNCQNKKPVDDNGNIIWDLTEYFQKGKKSTAPTPTPTTQPQNAIGLLKVKLAKLGANNDEEACGLVADHSGVVLKTMKGLTEQQAKEILELFVEKIN